MKTYKTKLPEITLKYKTGDVNKVKIGSSQDANDMFKKFFDQDTIELTESMIVIYLNRNNNTLGWQKISQGGLNGTVIDNRLILATALQCAAHSIILAHNHPSGNVKPSHSDLQVTKKLKLACETLEINLLDHLVVTSDNGYYSMADECDL